MMAVLEDDELPSPSLVAFAATVFLEADFVTQFLSDPIPRLAVQVVQGFLAGKSPVLSLDAIRTANSSGTLNLYILHYTEKFPDRYPEHAKRGTRNKMMHELLMTHRGYGLNQIIHEFCGDDVLPYSMASGMQKRTSYLDYFARHNLPVPAPARRPYLVGLTRDEERGHWGTALSLLFNPPLPVFRFSRIQQDVLWIALFEQDDDAWIAKRLGITTHAVRWRWQNICGRVENIRPGFFDVLKQQSGVRDVDRPHRGPEKRRFLIGYVRQHVEELQPLVEESAKSPSTSFFDSAFNIRIRL